MPAPQPAVELPAPVSGRFLSGVHHYPVRVYFEDTDAGGIVYHANYLRFMERARSDMLRLVGIDQRRSIEAGEGQYTVSRVEIDYRGSARLDDDLMVVSHVVHIGGATCTMEQRILRGDDLLTQGQVTAAFISSRGRATRQPKEWVALFNRIAQREELHS